jgi:hypothetical protein
MNPASQLTQLGDRRLELLGELVKQQCRAGVAGPLCKS